MKLAFSTIGCPNWSYDEVVSTASDLGYDGFEVRGIGGEIYAPDVKQFKPVATSHLFVFVVETVRVGFPSSSEQQSAIRRVRHPVEACILCLL